jgi:broad specificity phosphatase PhoE
VHLLLVRHGESYVNLPGWNGGMVDASLTALGERQAKRLGRWMAEHVRIDALYTSTMARTVETAACIAAETGAKLHRDDRLREFGNCYADGHAVPAESMPVQYPDFWGTERPYAPICERGESWMLFRVRIGSFLDDVLARYGTGIPENPVVVVVCHGGVIDAAFDYVFNVGPHRRCEIWTHNTGIVHWEYLPNSEREKWRLHAHGLVQHLITEDGEWLGGHDMLHDSGRALLPVPRP